MANPPLVTQGTNFLKIKSRLNREIRSAVALSSSIASSAGLCGLNTGTKLISYPGPVIGLLTARPELAVVALRILPANGNSRNVRAQSLRRIPTARFPDVHASATPVVLPEVRSKYYRGLRRFRNPRSRLPRTHSTRLVRHPDRAMLFRWPETTPLGPRTPEVYISTRRPRTPLAQP